MSIFEKFQRIAVVREELERCGAMPLGPVIETIASPTRGRLNGREVILAGTNNYLGLTFDPECIAAAQRALEEQGTGTTGSRMANGTYGAHVALERELADFFDARTAIVFSAGYLATMGMASTLAGSGDVILLDSDSHASLYDGCRMSGAEVVRFRHNDVADLEKRLRRLGGRTEETLIIVEGLYSMLGDRAPLEEIVALKRRYGGYLMLDEAHSLGMFGHSGRGLAQEVGVEDDVDFIVGTFSKSLGSTGGFCVSRRPELELVRYAIRPYIFTASASPSVIGSTRKALEILRARPELRVRLWENARRLHSGLLSLAYSIGADAGPVVAIYQDSRAQALANWSRLLDDGVYVNLVLPPASPGTTCLLRCSVSAAHTPDDIDQILAAFAALRTDRTSPVALGE